MFHFSLSVEVSLFNFSQEWELAEFASFLIKGLTKLLGTYDGHLARFLFRLNDAVPVFNLLYDGFFDVNRLSGIHGIDRNLTMPVTRLS